MSEGYWRLGSASLGNSLVTSGPIPEWTSANLKTHKLNFTGLLVVTAGSIPEWTQASLKTHKLNFTGPLLVTSGPILEWI